MTSPVYGMAFWSVFLQGYKDREPQVFCFEECTNMIALYTAIIVMLEKSCDTSFEGLDFLLS